MICSIIALCETMESLVHHDCLLLYSQNASIVNLNWNVYKFELIRRKTDYSLFKLRQINLAVHSGNIERNGKGKLHGSVVDFNFFSLMGFPQSISDKYDSCSRLWV